MKENEAAEQEARISGFRASEKIRNDINPAIGRIRRDEVPVWTNSWIGNSDTSTPSYPRPDRNTATNTGQRPAKP